MRNDPKEENQELSPSSYLLAVLVTAIIFVVRYVLDLALGPAPHFLLPFSVAILLAAWRGGMRVGLFTTALNTLSSLYFLGEEKPYWHIEGAEWARLFFFVLSGILTSYLCETLHESRRGLEREAEQRCELERLLRAREEQLQLVTDTTEVFLVHYDLERRYTFVNGPYADRFGCSPQDFIGKPIDEMLGDQGYEIFRPYLDEAFAGQRVDFEAEISYPRLGARRVHCIYQPERGADGRIQGVVATVLDITEKIQSAASLRASNERYHLLSDALPNMVWGMRADRSLDFVNHHTLEFTGLTLAEIQERGWKSLIDMRDLAHMREATADQIHRLATFEVEHRMLHHSHEYRWVLSRAVPLNLEEEEAVRWVGCTIDIHDRRLAESALRRSERRYRALVEATPQTVWTVDGLGKGLHPWWSDLTGQSADDMEGWGWLESIHPDDREATRKAWRSALETRSLYESEYRLRKNSQGACGEYRHFLARAVPLLDADEEVIEWIGTLTDITLRKRAELALREHSRSLEVRVAERTRELEQQEERFRLAFDHAPIGKALVGTDGSWLRVNQALCAIVGYSETELLASNFQQITHPDDLGADLHFVEDLLAGDIRNYQMEKRYLHKLGHHVHVILSVALVRDEEGQPSYFISQIVDITERHAAENKTRAALLEKEVMLKEIHHRVKNNLQIISSLLDLQSEYIDDERSLEMFRESRNRVRSMALIHERLYQAGDLALVDFHQYIHQLADDLCHSYSSPELDLTLTITIECPKLPIDIAIPCGLLLNEFVSNCLKHAFRGKTRGQLGIQLCKHDEIISLSVADDGCGMPADAQTRSAGTFGMQLIATLVKQIGGKLQYTQDEGTRVCVSIPAPK